ncbi:hypothetical protein IQ22_03322 [Pseudomonas duriflava]|uniref:Uncharacterized protein n=1 Tax=Pseudomonas duriflava TaxID=459528 RepID=A0A562Q717_9PSED|nr:hypothetical protein IQ22_03322 [Pseudomonas duriflava]
MKQRDVQDRENTVWTCVQAFSSSNAKRSKAAEKRAQDNNGHVAVSCTPSGGAQSVRLSLPLEWHERFSDEELLQGIQAARR